MQIAGGHNVQNRAVQCIAAFATTEINIIVNKNVEKQNEEIFEKFLRQDRSCVPSIESYE